MASICSSIFKDWDADTAAELAFRLLESPNEKMTVWTNFWQDIQKTLLLLLV